MTSPTEIVRQWRPAGLAGVEVLHVRNSVRLWRKFHDTYTICMNRWVASDLTYRGRVCAIAGEGTFLAEPGEVHVNPRVRAAQAFDVIFVDPPLVVAAAAELGAPGAAPHWRGTITADPVTFAGLDRLHRALAADDATTLERQTQLAHCLRVLLTGHVERRATDREPAPARHPAVRRAREYLDAHYAEDVTLDALAREAYLSKYHLARVFCAEVGIPPHAYLTELRVAAARRLLADGCPISDAAYRVGFAAQTHLHRHFVRSCGVTPGGYARGAATRRTAPAAPGV